MRFLRGGGAGALFLTLLLCSFFCLASLSLFLLFVLTTLMPSYTHLGVRTTHPRSRAPPPPSATLTQPSKLQPPLTLPLQSPPLPPHPAIPPLLHPPSICFYYSHLFLTKCGHLRDITHHARARARTWLKTELDGIFPLIVLSSLKFMKALLKSPNLPDTARR